MAFTSVKYEYGGKGYEREIGLINFAAGDTTGSVASNLTRLLHWNLSNGGTVNTAVVVGDCYLVTNATLNGTSGTGMVLSGSVAFSRSTGTVYYTGTSVAATYAYELIGFRP